MKVNIQTSIRIFAFKCEVGEMMKDVISVHLCVSQIDGKTMTFVLGFTGVLLHDLVKAVS